MEHHSSVKKNEDMKFSSTQMDLENFVVSVGSKVRKTNTVYSLMQNLA